MSALPARFYVKSGASLQLLVGIANDDGSAFDLTGVTPTAQVRASDGTLVDTLAITVTGVAGQLSVLQDTSAWPLGTLACDFKLTQGSVVLKSDTWYLVVLPAITA